MTVPDVARAIGKRDSAEAPCGPRMRPPVLWRSTVTMNKKG
jgi:hypothetical protein